MKRISHRAVTVVAAGVLGVGAFAAASPALAGAGSGMGSGVGSGVGMGAGMGMGSGYAIGTCPGLGAPVAKGSLTTAQQATLQSMAQEEKLAYDVYAAFAGRRGTALFGHLAMSESHHLSAVRAMLQRYALTDPTAGQPAGRFTDPAVRTAYDRLLAQGSTSPAAARAAGRQVERDDIARLEAASAGLTAPDVRQLYTMLLSASEQHLAVLAG
ncbi:DUF2202 domain-containing protein [Couchioplanes caeruleus]|uniref:DUF2202 domain-containing protein n=1 Tax=Couchioplanes caeruleus TaxID=56438 RepID=UPI0020C0754C|nr:DUF2202 domain-containing protein [Couchioplanes caeruleus]UQU61769.1 DUF2202 domain-containing protein [Couchioplanes caeruleus]